MKKLILTLFTICVLSIVSFAQDFEERYVIVPLNDTLTATIIAPNGYYLAGVQIIADTVGSATKIEKFWVSSSLVASEFLPLYDEKNAIVELTFGIDRSYTLPVLWFYPWKYYKFEFDAVFAVYTNQFIKAIFRRY